MRTRDAERGEGHVPVRMCVICRERRPKSELSRYVRTQAEARLVPDEQQTQPGRGYYVCNREECRKRFEKFSLRK